MAASVNATNMQISRKGGMDNLIYNNPFVEKPDLYIFNYTYNTIAPFARHTASIPFDGPVGFGKTGTCTIPLTNGHLLHKTQLYAKLPPLALPQGSTYVGWTQSIGYAMIDYVEFLIDEKAVSKCPGWAMEVVNYLETPVDKALNVNSCVGRYDNINVVKQNALSPQDIYLEFPFWFCKKIKSSLPLLSLSGHVIKIRVKFNSFDKLVSYDGPNVPVHIPMLEVGIVGNFFILTDEEKQTYLTEPQEYLIEEWQFELDTIPRGVSTSKYKLPFTRCVKEIMWFFVETESKANNDSFMFGLRNPGNVGGAMISKASLLFDGFERYSKLPESFYRKEHYHTFLGNRNIYNISFAENPEMNQPTGTANFSLFDDIELCFDFVEDVPECILHTLAINYNRLVIHPTGDVQIDYLT